jgi:hypothetical protein
VNTTIEVLSMAGENHHHTTWTRTILTMAMMPPFNTISHTTASFQRSRVHDLAFFFSASLADRRFLPCIPIAFDLRDWGPCAPWRHVFFFPLFFFVESTLWAFHYPVTRQNGGVLHLSCS